MALKYDPTLGNGLLDPGMFGVEAGDQYSSPTEFFNHWLSALPGAEQFAGDTLPDSSWRSVDWPAFQKWLDDQGLQYQGIATPGQFEQGWVDKNNNQVGDLRTNSVGDNTFWNAALLASAGLGGGIGTWANLGDVAGAAAAGGGSLGSDLAATGSYSMPMLESAPELLPAISPSLPELAKTISPSLPELAKTISPSLPELAKTIAPVAAAVAGAASAKDQQATTSHDPWGPAQPFIQQNIERGQQLQQQYQQNPFSQQQQTAYNNIGGLLNAVNGGAPGLLAGLNATASGANNFDRANPRKALTGGGYDLSSFSPGLLNFFPQSRG